MIKSLLEPLKSPEIIPVPFASSGARMVCDDAVSMIQSFENLARVGNDGMIYPYHDAIGLPTIGWGHLLSKVKGEDLSKYPALTRGAADELLKRDLDKFSIGVCNLITVPLSDNQFGALVCLAFNIGLGNLQASSLRRKLNRGESIANCCDEFLKWNKAGGKVLNGLTRRRIAERKLFLN